MLEVHAQHAQMDFIIHIHRMKHQQLVVQHLLHQQQDSQDIIIMVIIFLKYFFLNSNRCWSLCRMYRIVCINLQLIDCIDLSRRILFIKWLMYILWNQLYSLHRFKCLYYMRCWILCKQWILCLLLWKYWNYNQLFCLHCILR